MVEGSRKVVEGNRKVVEGGRKVVEGGRKVVLGPQNCFYWGAAAPQSSPLFLGGFQPPRPPGGEPAALCARSFNV